jgi:hypothetical protein
MELHGLMKTTQYMKFRSNKAVRALGAQLGSGLLVLGVIAWVTKTLYGWVPCECWTVRGVHWRCALSPTCTTILISRVCFMQMERQGRRGSPPYAQTPQAASRGQLGARRLDLVLNALWRCV